MIRAIISGQIAEPGSSLWGSPGCFRPHLVKLARVHDHSGIGAYVRRVAELRQSSAICLAGGHYLGYAPHLGSRGLGAMQAVAGLCQRDATVVLQANSQKPAASRPEHLMMPARLPDPFWKNTIQWRLNVAAPKARVYTIEQYLSMERAAPERHIFLDGEIFAMAGESGQHGDISMNIGGLFFSQLKGTSCRARTKDTKVRSGRTPLPEHSISGMFSYPDIVIICGEPEYHDAFRDVVLNPTAIVEVLSRTTEAFDRGEKFTRYQNYNPTLREYVLLSQDQPQVEVFTRQEDRKWQYCSYAGLEATVVLPSIQCTLRLADVYDRVQFSVGESGSLE